MVDNIITIRKTYSFEVLSNNAITINGVPTWLSQSVTGGDGRWTITLTTIQSNATGLDRSANIVVSNGFRSKGVRVIQKTVSTSISAPATVTLGWQTGNTVQFQVQSNYQVSFESLPAWATVGSSQQSGNVWIVTLRATQDNEAGSQRSQRITVTNGYDDATINLIQSQATSNLSVTPNSITLPYTGAAQNATVTSVYPITIVSKPDWATVNVTGGNGTYNLAVSATQNDSTSSKSGNVQIRDSSGATISLAINQQGQSNGITVSPTSLSLNYEANNSKTVNVVSGYPISVTNLPSWLSHTISGSVGNYVVTFTTIAVNTGLPRTQAVTIQNSEGGSATVSITQEVSGEISVQSNPLTLAATQGALATQVVTTYFAVQSVTGLPTWAAWNITGSADGRTIVQFSTTQANVGASRSSNVTITNKYGNQATFLLTQKGSGVKLAYLNESLYPQNGGTLRIRVTAEIPINYILIHTLSPSKQELERRQGSTSQDFSFSIPSKNGYPTQWGGTIIAYDTEGNIVGDMQITWNWM